MVKLRKKLRAGKGFTIIELIVVIAIIGILAALIVPALTYDTRPSKGKAMAKDMFYTTQDIMSSVKTAAPNAFTELGSSASEIIFYATVNEQGEITDVGTYESLVLTPASSLASVHKAASRLDAAKMFTKTDTELKKYITDIQGMRGRMFAVVDTDFRVQAAYWLEEDDSANASTLLASGGDIFEEDCRLPSGYLCCAYPTQFSGAAPALKGHTNTKVFEYK